MNYKSMMGDSAGYIARHIREGLDADSLGQVYSYTGAYYGYLFGAYYKVALEEYIEKIREKIMSGKMIYKDFYKRKMLTEGQIERRTTIIPAFVFGGESVIRTKKDKNDPIRRVTDQYKAVRADKNGEKPWISIWWHDESYEMEYLAGTVWNCLEEVPESKVTVTVPESKYAIFSLKAEEKNLEEAMKSLTNYVYGSWMEENEGKTSRLGYIFQVFLDERAYFCLPLLDEREQEPKDKVYSIESWTKYIDDHITMNMTTTALAEQFHYSDTHFKRIFRYYYKMSVSDYIRKRRLQAAAEQIRQGEKCTEVAARYNFKTYAGFSRAFQKEFGMTPAAYSSNVFEVVDLRRYYKEYKDRLVITFLEMKELKMIGQSVLLGKGEDADIPAQVCYWLEHDFPCLENTRFSCNKERREDKIALWYHVPERADIEYILGPVVEKFDEDIPDEMVKVVVEGGKYAMFQTEKESDKDNVPETLRMFTRCALYGWIKEHEEYVDLSRITFERYLDNKIYIYVPIKDQEGVNE